MVTNVNSAMGDAMFCRVEKTTVLAYIGYNDICANARFVFDHPIRVDPDDLLELVDGCWHLLTQGERIVLPGKWDR